MVITGVDAGSPAADKRLLAGDVIVEIAQEAVETADDLQAKIDKLKKDGRRLGVAPGCGRGRRIEVRRAELAVRPHRLSAKQFDEAAPLPGAAFVWGGK